MGRKKEKIVKIGGVKFAAAVGGIADYLSENVLVNFPDGLDEDTSKWLLETGRIPCEPRAGRERYITACNSLDALIDPNCDIRGLSGMAAYTGYSLRQMKRKVKNGTAPWDRLGDRFYCCTSSLDGIKKPDPPK